MVLHHLCIERFRGIQSLDWHVGGRIVCLVGSGDSTKTAILDAIELALYPRAFFQFTDADFFNGDLTNPIRIEATVGDLPTELTREDKFGLWKRGYDGQIRDEPLAGCQEVLTLRLTVNAELEPAWEIIKDAMGEPKSISQKDREKLGMVRLGDEIERHLTWARGSALNRLTEDQDATGKMFVTAARKARETVTAAELAELNEAAKKASEAAASFGANIGDARAGLDPVALSLGTSALGLQTGTIPVRQQGLGTRRLAALAIQQQGAGINQILLTDEIESALEPHRLRHLLKLFVTAGGVEERKTGQVIFSTHSPTPIMALDARAIRIVRSTNGMTTITPVPASLQSIARSQSLAFLARKVVVCEGKTEEAVVRSLEAVWAEKHQQTSYALLGVVPVDGGGSNAHTATDNLHALGFKTALFCDTDVASTPSSAALTAKGISVFEWQGKMSIEERISQDLLTADLQKLMKLVFDTKDEDDKQLLLQSLANRANQPQAAKLGPDLQRWLQSGVPEPDLRLAFAKSAKSDGWFKNLNDGQLLGRAIGEALPAIPN
jgi:hypothetical protein